MGKKVISKCLHKMTVYRPSWSAADRLAEVERLKKIGLSYTMVNEVLYEYAGTKDMKAVEKELARRKREKLNQRHQPPKGEPHDAYSKIFRVVDGAIRDCFNMHPEYVDDERKNAARLSLSKRITAQVLSLARLADSSVSQQPRRAVMTSEPDNSEASADPG